MSDISKTTIRCPRCTTPAMCEAEDCRWGWTSETDYAVDPDKSQTTKPQRVQRKRAKGWRMPDNTVCVDRTTGFGSPFPIASGTSTGVDGIKKIWMVGTWSGPAMWVRGSKTEAAEISVKAFRAWFEKQETLQEKARLVLRGKNLACWCAPDQPCHADVLLECANAE